MSARTQSFGDLIEVVAIDQAGSAMHGHLKSVRINSVDELGPCEARCTGSGADSERQQLGIWNGCERRNCVGKILRPITHEVSRLAVQNSLLGPAAVDGDHRLSARHGLQRDEAPIFVWRWKDDPDAALIEIDQAHVSWRLEEFDIRSIGRGRAKMRQVWPTFLVVCNPPEKYSTLECARSTGA